MWRILAIALALGVSAVAGAIILIGFSETVAQFSDELSRHRPAARESVGEVRGAGETIFAGGMGDRAGRPLFHATHTVAFALDHERGYNS